MRQRRSFSCAGFSRAVSQAPRHPRGARARSGFTLLELLIASSLLLFILGASTRFMQRQSQGIAAASGRLEAQQNAYFGISSLERELRTAGAGVVDKQPMLVHAGPLALVFNANLVSRVKGDVAPVYVDVDADSNSTDGFPAALRMRLPNSSVNYPDTTYMQSAGVPSAAETIAFWLSKDSTAKSTNEYILWRRVNAMVPRVVAKGVVVNASDTVFQYLKADTAGRLVAVPTSNLPLYHSAMNHGAPNDTGPGAVIDSIRSIRIRLTVVYHDPRSGDATRHLERTIRIMNSGLQKRTSCGDGPLSVLPAAVALLSGSSTPYVNITWPASIDEAAGEKDVERYAIFRRPTGSVAFTEAFASIPAGSTAYSFIDTDVKTGESWVYGVASQDCTPTMSTVGVAPAVIIP